MIRVLLSLLSQFIKTKSYGRPWRGPERYSDHPALLVMSQNDRRIKLGSSASHLRSDKRFHQVRLGEREKIPANEEQKHSGINWLRAQSGAKEAGGRIKLDCRQSKAVHFESTFIPHIDAAYNLARWVVRDDHDAQDGVQGDYLRAFTLAGGFRGGDRRARILAIVRNTAYTSLERNRGSDSPTEFDEKAHV